MVVVVSWCQSQIQPSAYSYYVLASSPEYQRSSSGDSGEGTSSMSVQLGIFGVLLASVFWGSNCVVCRGYDLPDDGMHVVLLMATGILFVGILSLFTAPQEICDFEVFF